MVAQDLFLGLIVDVALVMSFNWSRHILLFSINSHLQCPGGCARTSDFWVRLYGFKTEGPRTVMSWFWLVVTVQLCPIMHESMDLRRMPFSNGFGYFITCDTLLFECWLRLRCLSTEPSIHYFPHFPIIESYHPLKFKPFADCYYWIDPFDSWCTFPWTRENIRPL